MGDVDVASERAKGPSVDGVPAIDVSFSLKVKDRDDGRVGGGVDVGPGRVDRMVDRKRGRVEDLALGRPALDDLAVGADEDEVLEAHHGELAPERVDPEAIRSHARPGRSVGTFRGRR